MIPPADQWAVQIDVTNACPRSCSNCTRLTAHVRTPFYMGLGAFENAVRCVADFVDQGPDRLGRRRVIGIIGGEPLCHQAFDAMALTMEKIIPHRMARGLWTGLPLAGHPSETLINRVFGYVNHNLHGRELPSRHSPVLTAVGEVVDDPVLRAELVEKCWLQREWASSITPKGHFFCEVAASLDMVFDGPGGLPVEPGCWRRELGDFAEQIDTWCPRCGICLNQAGRLDHEEIDDISPGNLETLRTLGSPRVLAGRVEVHTEPISTVEKPWRYRQ